MGISLHNAMKLGRFSECKVMAGHEGLKRVVENVTVMEIPEIAPWLKGGELILTSLFAIREDLDAQNVLIQNLNRAGATALAVKTSQFMESIPEAMINNANKLDFPIIQIPSDIRYLDILSPVMHHVFNEKVVLQEDLEQATKVLHEISLSTQGIEEFVKSVGYITKNIVTIESEFSFIQIPLPEKEISPLSKDEIYELSIIQRPIHLERKYGTDNISCIVAPIINEGEYYGNITCWEVNSEHLSTDLAILEKASSLLSLEFLRLKVKYDVEQQYRSDFIRELLFSENIKQKNVIEWGGKYRITNDTEYVCLLCDAKEKSSKVKNYTKLKDYKINNNIKEIQPDMLVGHIRNGVCIIIPVNKRNMSKVYEEIYSTIASYIGSDFLLSLGIGRVGLGPEGIQKSFLQAEQALYLNETIQESKGILYYDDLGAYRLLNQLKGQKELRDFYEETIGELIKQDANNELLKTLKVYFLNNEVLKKTANSLYIHINTLKYRIRKIEDITKCELKTSEGKMNLFLGLKIHEMMNFDKK